MNLFFAAIVRDWLPLLNTLLVPALIYVMRIDRKIVQFEEQHLAIKEKVNELRHDVDVAWSEIRSMREAHSIRLIRIEENMKLLSKD